MRTIRTAILLLFLVSIAALAAGQRNNLVAKEQFQRKYDALNRAVNGKDIKLLDSLIAPAYSAGDRDHPMTKAMTLESVKNFKSSAKANFRKVLGVVVNGRRATATVEMVTEKHIPDAKQDHVYQIKTRSIDTWVLNADWQMLHSQIVRKILTKDGKPMLGHKPGH